MNNSYKNHIPTETLSQINYTDFVNITGKDSQYYSAFLKAIGVNYLAIHKINGNEIQLINGETFLMKKSEEVAVKYRYKEIISEDGNIYAVLKEKKQPLPTVEEMASTIN